MKKRMVGLQPHAAPFVKIMWTDVEQDGGFYVVSLMLEDAYNQQFTIDDAFETETLEQATEQIKSLANDLKSKKKD